MRISILRYAVLILILWFLPSFLLNYFSSTLGSLASYAISLGLVAHFTFTKNERKPLLPFVALGLSYFLLGALNYTGMDEDNYFIKEFIRFMIVVICGASVLTQTKDKEIFYLLLIGGASIIINAVFLPHMQADRFGESYGRFSGFYLNPNLAGSTCIMGYALSYAIKNTKWKLLGQIIFTLGGILTFSRTFIVLWLLLGMISIYNNKKNLVAPIIGGLAIILVLAFSSRLTLNTQRFGALQNVLGQGQGRAGVSQVGGDTRTDVWALYYNMIYDKPFLGHGYRKFQQKWVGLPGVHNTYLMIIGEAGIVPFLLIVGIYLYLLIKSYTYFKTHPWYFYIISVSALSMMGGHGYFSNLSGVIMAMYIYIKLRDLSSKQRITINGSNNINE